MDKQDEQEKSCPSCLSMFESQTRIIIERKALAGARHARESRPGLPSAHFAPVLL
jgi:hypothetical protein